MRNKVLLLILALTCLACLGQSIQPTLSPLPPAPTLDTSATRPVETATTLPSTPTGTTGAEPVTPTDTAQPATLIPTSDQPGIAAFTVTPDRVRPGDTVTLTWATAGAVAQICPSTAFYEYFSEEDCMDVPLAGSMEFVIPADLHDGYREVSFTLKALSPVALPDPEETVAVRLICDLEWFFDADTDLIGCPFEAITTNAAFQDFEHGTMFWLEQPGRYFILYQREVGESHENRYSSIYDPLDIVRDTSGAITPPEGLLAPSSGFGYVWRGDVDGVDGFRDSLGWAIMPEEGYQATFQCDNAPPTGGRSWQACYLSTPEGQVISLMPDGWWMYHDGL